MTYIFVNANLNALLNGALSTCQNISCLLEKDAHLISADETGSIPVSEKFTQLLHFNWIRLRITVGNS